MSLSIDIEKVMEIVEEFLKRENRKFKVKSTRYSLRYVEYRLRFKIGYMWGAEIILPFYFSATFITFVAENLPVSTHRGAFGGMVH